MDLRKATAAAPEGRPRLRRPQRPRRRWILVATSALVLAACGDSGDGEGATVLDFAEIQAGEVTITPDLTGTVATLEVGTTVEAVCAVAYGTTDALGQIATDTDMAGGGHSDHHPLLTGLEPDTEYFYRLQGVDAAGRLYQSDVMTFRTPVASPDAAPGTNVAPSATVADVSSEFSAAFAAANAIDGDPGTEWSTAGDGDDAFLEVDLGQPQNVVAVGFHSREMTDGTAITLTYTVTVDGGEVFGPFDAGEGMTVSPVEFTGQVVRFDVATSTGGNTGAVDLAVYVAG